MLIYESKLAAKERARLQLFDEKQAQQQEFNTNIEEQIANIRKIVLETNQKLSENKKNATKSPKSSNTNHGSNTDEPDTDDDYNDDDDLTSFSSYEFTEEERERILAFHKTTIEESIQQLTTVVTEDNILAKLYDTLFFAKPSMLLRELVSAPANMPWVSIPRLMQYVVDGIRGPDGKAGEDGENGNYGGGAGTDGTDGLDGQAGSHASCMTVSVVAVPNQNIFLVTPKTANPVMLPLFDSSVSVQLSARGGDGGDGGRGGKGGDGSAGIDGTDATPDRMGTSGTNGKFHLTLF
jgi:hypothetical protein